MKTLFLKPKNLLICALAIAFSATFCSASLEFLDTFENADGGNINDNLSAAGRQSGPQAPMAYFSDGNSTGTTLITSGEAVMAEGFQIRGHNASYISLGHNYNDVGENFTVQVDAKIDYVSSWNGFVLCVGAESPHDIIDSVDGTLNGHSEGINWWLDTPGESSAPQLIVHGDNYVSSGYTGYNCDPLYNIRSEMLHFNAVSYTKSFGGLDKVYHALFCNSKPIVGGTAGVGAMYIVKSFTNNYVILGEESGDHATTITMDNVSVNATDPKIVSAAWTSDASSSINSAKTYTHKVNIGHTGDTTINGVTFTGAGSATSGANWELLDYLNGTTALSSGSETTAITGTGAALATDYAYSQVNSTLMLSGLTPGANYTLTLFNNAGATAVDSFLIPCDSEAAVNIVDQNQSNGTTLRYNYDAPANGVFTMTFNNTNGVSTADGNFRLYAFSNEAIPEPSLIFGLIALIGMLIRVKR